MEFSRKRFVIIVRVIRNGGRVECGSIAVAIAKRYRLVEWDEFAVEGTIYDVDISGSTSYINDTTDEVVHLIREAVHDYIEVECKFYAVAKIPSAKVKVVAEN